ncbi:Beta-amyrin 16-alpha-hydroxylase CYP87D16 [Linum grandiflorum]
METTVPCLVLSVMILAVAYWFRKQNKSPSTNLPPGTVGFPVIGEILQLLRPATDFDLIPFLKTRIKRYGPIFRTKLLGTLVVVSADPKFNRYLLQQEDKLVEQWYTDNFSKLITDDYDNNVPSLHKYLRTTTMRAFGVQVLKDKLLPEIEHLVHETLDEWSSRPFVEVKYASASMALEYGAKLTFGYDPQRSKEKLIDLYCLITKGLVSIPLNFPGTTHYKCLKGKEKVTSMIRNELKKRRATSSIPTQGSSKGDYLDYAMEELDGIGHNSNSCLSEESIVNIIFGINFASHDSVSTTMSLAVKLIEEHPLVLEQLVAEHEAILKGREGNHESAAAGKLSWAEYKSMTFTLQVIHETLRLGNIAPGLLRKAKTDLQVNGYTIPAGTGIFIATSAVHLDPQTYEDPLIFNPWRWNGKRASEMYKDLMPFGWGMKQCSGSEFAKLFLATFLHVLVTKYTWKKIKGGQLRRNPFLDFGKGLHVKFMHKHK